jgi:uncharacterized protein (TIGR02646 family)
LTPDIDYGDLQNPLKSKVREELCREQYYLCAYCCRPIQPVAGLMHIDHLKDQSSYPEECLNYSNFVGSCETRNSCGDSKSNKDLPITPYEDKCETDIQYSAIGEIQGLTDDAEKMITDLNLVSKLNCRVRESAIEPFIEHLEDEDQIRAFIAYFETPLDGALPEYGPVVASYLKSCLP